MAPTGALDLAQLVALFGTMTALASLPSVSVLTVSARAATFGFAHGALTAAGIVVGDVLFILFALFGLAVLVNTLGGYFVLVEIVGGAYLLWVGVSLWRSAGRAASAQPPGGRSGASSFLIGLSITLGDQKAILFYLGFFPLFLDLQAMRAMDAALLMFTAILAVGTPKLVYALIASRVGKRVGNACAFQWLNRLAAVMVIAIGVSLFVRAVV
ncbi:MAG: LysE family translocator [Chromatiales bacterium]|nr:LysE family translocator [Chromatiales bacterium]